MTINSNAQADAVHKAVIVVDIQENYTGITAKPPFPYKDSEKLIASINTLLEKAVEQGVTVVYTTQEFDGFIGTLASKLLFKGVSIKGQPGTELDPRLQVVSDNHIAKSNLNAFSSPDLQAVLEKHQIEELYFVGLDSAYCLDKTAKGGVRSGYKVTLIDDCIVTQFEERWKRLRQGYDKIGISVISSHDFLESLT